MGPSSPPFIAVTDWSSRDDAPHRKGVYEVEMFKTTAWFQYFDGRDWWQGGPSPRAAQMAYEDSRRTRTLASSRWRGLNRDLSI